MAGDDPKSSTHEENDDGDPYYDPFTEEELLNIMSDANPNLMDDLTFTEDPPLLPLPPRVTTATTDICETNHGLVSTLDDDLDFKWDVIDMSTSYNVGETGRLEVSNRVFVENGVNFETGGSSVPAPPITPTISDGIFLCTCCCSLLRTLIHTNGQEIMRLDIHGGIGYFCHAILEIQRLDGSTESRYQTIRLNDLTMEDVQKFIEDYCAARAAGGFEVVQDNYADFYQAMSACSIDNQSLMWPLPPRDDVPMTQAMHDQTLNLPSGSGYDVRCSIDNQPLMWTLPLLDDVPMFRAVSERTLNVPSVPLYVGLRDEPPVPKARRRRQTPLARQRERAGKLKLKDLSMHFHLPMAEAARRLSLCSTVVKKICRKGGLYRWPHRRIKSLLNRIMSLRSVLDTTRNVEEEVRAHIEAEIDELEERVREICREALRNA